MEKDYNFCNEMPLVDQVVRIFTGNSVVEAKVLWRKSGHESIMAEIRP